MISCLKGALKPWVSFKDLKPLNLQNLAIAVIGCSSQASSIDCFNLILQILHPELIYKNLIGLRNSNDHCNVCIQCVSGRRVVWGWIRMRILQWDEHLEWIQYSFGLNNLQRHRYVFVWLCVCTCVWKEMRDKERQIKREEKRTWVRDHLWSKYVKKYNSLH